MASIIKKIKKGRPYYYAVESKRVNGKPRIVWQKYLGTLEAIVGRAKETKPPPPKEAVLSEAGGVAALLGVARRLGVLDLINEVVPKRKQGPSLGHYLLLAALNRAVAPCSKLAIGDWYESTVLHRLWRFPKADFSSQRFWDHMDRVSEKDIETLQERLLPRIHDAFGVDGGLLLYDTTNFFTFLATSNDRADLPRRGRSKAKRHDLRQIGLALVVSRDFQIPLFHRTYSGNIPDVSLFPELAKELVARTHALTGGSEEATLVFDKGNVSDDGMERLVVSGTHFVAALSAGRFREILATPIDSFEELPDFPGTRAFATQAELWGLACRVVVTYTESFFTQQLAGVTQNLVKCQKKLLDLEKSLRKWRKGKGRGKKPTVPGVKKSVARILSPQFMKDLFRTAVEKKDGLPQIQYSLDHEALERLSRERLGRTLLVTDRIEWKSSRVVETYRGLSHIEDTFKRMKDIAFLHWQPAYHWTDQKLRVHAFYCVLALLLASLARKVAFQAGVDLSLHALLKDLTAIREVAVIYPQGSLAHRKDHVTLSRMSPRQKKLAEALGIANTLEG